MYKLTDGSTDEQTKKECSCQIITFIQSLNISIESYTCLNK